MCIVVYKLVDMSDVEAIYGVIYKITCLVNGKIYIGQTTRSVEERFQEHMDSPYPLGCAIRKHGVENFKIEVIAVCATKEELDAQEIRFIAEYDCMVPKGYNCTAGGHNGSLSEETKARLSAAVLAYNAAHPEIHEIISEANIRRFSDPVEREKQAERTRKSFEDPERAAKHAESQRRRFEDPAERQKVADGVSAHFSKPGEREAQSERIKAYFDTPGAREKCGESQSKRFEDPAERDKVSVGLKKYFAEHPEAAAAISARTKGRQDSTETHERKSRGQKARQARLRLERLPLLVANQNRSAAKWKPLPIDLKNFHVEQLGDIEKIFADAKRLKEQRRSARRRAKRKLQSIAAENLSAANLPAKIALS